MVVGVLLAAGWIVLRIGRETSRSAQKPETVQRAESVRPIRIDALEGSNPSRAGGGHFADEDPLTVIRRWATLHPGEAAVWAESLPEGPAKVESLSHVAMVWGECDSAAALAWACQLPQGEGREKAVMAVGYEAVRLSPTNAIQAAGLLESGPARNQLMLHAVNQWAVIDPLAALQWTQGVKEGGLRDELFAGIATAWAKLDGEVAARLAAQTIRADDVGRRAVVAVVQRWHRMNPTAAKQWIESMPDSALRHDCHDVLNRDN